MCPSIEVKDEGNVNVRISPSNEIDADTERKQGGQQKSGVQLEHCRISQNVHSNAELSHSLGTLASVPGYQHGLLGEYVRRKIASGVCLYL